MYFSSLLTSVLSITPALIFGHYYGLVTDDELKNKFSMEEGHRTEMNSIQSQEPSVEDVFNQSIFEQNLEFNEDIKNYFEV